MTTSGGARRFGVTGTPVIDTIVTAEGVRTDDMGGAYYTLLTLDALLPDAHVVIPILAVGADAETRVRNDWSKLARVRLDGLNVVDARNNTVYLAYAADGSREETQRGDLPALSWPDLAPWIDALDVWLWNLISGSETTLTTFEEVKRAFGGRIYLDLHSLCLEAASGGPRAPRRPPGWRAWVQGVTWLQLNAVEAGLLWRDRAEPLPPAETAALASALHDLGVREVLVTRGAEGAESYALDGPALTAPGVTVDALDPTGCGDVFGAAWCALRLGRAHPRERALAGAVRAAAAAATVRGTRALHATLTREFAHV